MKEKLLTILEFSRILRLPVEKINSEACKCTEYDNPCNYHKDGGKFKKRTYNEWMNTICYCNEKRGFLCEFHGRSKIKKKFN